MKIVVRGAPEKATLHGVCNEMCFFQPPAMHSSERRLLIPVSSLTVQKNIKVWLPCERLEFMSRMLDAPLAFPPESQLALP